MTRDALLPIVVMLALARDVPLAKMVRELPPRRTATDRLKDVPVDVSLRLVERILAGEAHPFPDDLGDVQEFDTIEGARITFSTGRIVTVRPSGNAPELRCYVEAESDALASSTLQEVLRRIRSEIA
jgi:phosphomannomutase